MNNGATVTGQEPVRLCLLAGKIMLQNGAETYRVEDTMTRMANAVGLNSSHSYVTPTVIMFQSGDLESAKLIRIADRTTDLHKVAAVNDISRKLSGGHISAETAQEMLEAIDHAKHAYPISLQIMAAGISSGCFTLLFQGNFYDVLPGVLCGGLAFTSFIIIHHLIKVKFFAEFTSSLFVGLLAAILVANGIGSNLDKIIIGSVMPLVPGLVITNAVRDLMAGHLVSGLSRGAEAFLTAFAIGSGIAVILTFL